MCQVQNILAEGKVDINSRTGKYTRTPVMVAANEGHGNVFDVLVKKGCDLSHVDTKGNNILHLACNGGDIGSVSYILSQDNVDVNVRRHDKKTPLMNAAYHGRRRVFELVEERGGNVSLIDADGDNILHIACCGGHIEMVKYVLSHTKLDISSRGQYGRTPGMTAAYCGHIEVFDLLVERGGDASVRDDNGDNILHVACCGGHIEMVKYVLSLNKLDVKSRGQYGRTPVMTAAYCGHIKVFDLLVERGGDASVRDDNGDNILHVACCGGHIEMVKYVLSLNKLDINSRGYYERTPLMTAAFFGHEKVCEMLVERGCNISLKDVDGNNILHVICFSGYLNIVKYVLSLNKLDINGRGHYGRTPLMTAASSGHKEVFDLLVEKGGDVFLKDANGNNMLHIICFGGHFNLVKHVLSLNKLDINSRGRYGRTPLMTAAYLGQKKVFDLLVEKGGNVFLKDANGNTILHTACFGGHLDMVKHVLSLNKLDINSRGQYARTPLMGAAYLGHEKVFKLLVGRGSNVSLKDSYGQDAIQIACSRGHFRLFSQGTGCGKQSSPERCLQKKRYKNSRDVDNQLHAACCEGDMCQVRTILAEGKVNINSRTGKYKRTPVMVAANEGHGNVFDFLVKKGCDLSHVDTRGNSILHVACNGGDIATIRYVLSQSNVDVNGRNRNKRTPLMNAAYFGHKKAFELLVERGGNVSLTDANGDNILHRACYGGRLDMMTYVLSHTKLDINSRGQYGRTPLMLAAKSGHKRMFELLMDKGGDVSLRDDHSDNILHVVCYRGNVEMVKYILAHTKLDVNSKGYYGRTPLMVAANEGHKIAFELLVERGGDISIIDVLGNNIIHLACNGGDIESVRYILSQSNVDVNRRRRDKRTPLMNAAYNGHKKMFALIVERGGDVSLKDAGGDNILHRACYGGHLDMMTYVLSHIKLDINSRGRFGRTPMMAAAYSGHEELVEVLMERGGDVSLKDDHGHDIIQIACSYGHLDMLKSILSQDTKANNTKRTLIDICKSANSFISDSTDVCTKIRDITNPGPIISNDVLDLFPNVSREEALWALRHRIDNLQQPLNTSLSTDSIISLTSACINSTYFTWERNHHPPEIVNGTIEATLSTPTKRPKPESAPIKTSISYVGKISHQISRLLKQQANIDTTFSASPSLNNLLHANGRTQPTVNNDNPKYVIYKIYCDCGQSCIGETSRPLKTRVKEHRVSVTNSDSKSAISDHIKENPHHQTEWSDITILANNQTQAH
ncbi:serine/threonine-protein phosphatase 6 regulatory ankyrin repeat subunit B-like [Haliotis asinina]|uniref:serine/threonine-protein phosphatase 6 regulatory ankyrin repeat subunit B-like n=1 Tax=Haliotis asinina TaxID=109174 RepID=UPI0035320B3A